MKNLIYNLNKAFENRVRLGIMAVLMANDTVDFNMLKETLQVTDGNLASHSNALEKAGYVLVEKRFVGKKPNTTFQATKEGKKAFQDHLNALEKLINNT
jgi:DNA-binding MarR family transcriptional regulator